MSDETLRVAVREEEDVTIVAVHGDIMYDSHRPLLDVLMVAAEAAEPHVVVDLTDVAVCDSTGLRVLLQGHRRAVANGGWLRLGPAQPLVAEVLAITNLTRLLPVYGSVADAIAGPQPTTDSATDSA